MKNDETSQPSYKNDYMYYIKNPNANVYNPKNKDKSVKLQNVVNKIDKDDNINVQYKEFVNEFRNITNNTKIKYDYETYKDLILDRINNEDSNGSTIKEIGKKLLKI